MNFVEFHLWYRPFSKVSPDDTLVDMLIWKFKWIDIEKLLRNWLHTRGIIYLILENLVKSTLPYYFSFKIR